jgi:hypothetical protein
MLLEKIANRRAFAKVLISLPAGRAFLAGVGPASREDVDTRVGINASGGSRHLGHRLGHRLRLGGVGTRMGLYLRP